jgi:hypothetical protein
MLLKKIEVVPKFSRKGNKIAAPQATSFLLFLCALCVKQTARHKGKKRQGLSNALRAANRKQFSYTHRSLVSCTNGPIRNPIWNFLRRRAGRGLTK